MSDIGKANGAKIPAIGLGTWELRGATCASIVEHALRKGYRHIDTAEFYENENEVGEGLRASGVRRSEVFITTKVWGDHSTPAALKKAAKESLARLKLAELDLLLLHWANPAVPLADTLGALADMKKSGLTRDIGVANFTSALLDEAVASTDEAIVTNQIEYHPFLSQNKVVEACLRHNVSITAFCPIARGKVFESEPLRRIATTHRRSAAQVALRWLFQQGVIAIPRTTRIERLEENLRVFDFELTSEEMLEIGKLAEPTGRLVDYSWAPKWD